MNPDGGSDMAANAWPGFVDILSAVVIMFVFFVLITAAALYLHTVTYKAKEVGGSPEGPLIEPSKSPTSSPDSVPTIAAANDSNIVEELERQNKQLREEIESANAALGMSGGELDTEGPNDSPTEQSFGEQSFEQNLLTLQEERAIILFYDPGAITVNEESKEEISAFIERMVSQYGAANLEVALTSPKLGVAKTQTRAKRLAVARMLNVRNVLLDSTIDRKNIDLEVVESEEIEDSSDWTRFQINVVKANVSK